MSHDMQTHTEQLVSGTEKTRRQALAALIEGGTEGFLVLQDFLLGLRDQPIDSFAGRVYIALAAHPNEGVQAFLQTHFPKGFLPLPSDRGLDYRPLETLLVQQKFQAADLLTLQKMCELAGETAQKRKWIYFSEVDRFPVADLRTLDTLWRVYSDDRFGFSVQRELWIGGGQNWETLWGKIGWRKGSLWTRYPHAFTWDLSAPKGHLPLTNQLRGVRVMAALMNHPAFAEPAREV